MDFHQRQQERLSSKSVFYNSPCYEFLSPFRPVQNQWVIKYIITIFAILIRSAVSLGGYSGHANPPFFGDFEAQRHWLDLTINLPISKWYYYKLGYWGLDYPPLTAYHSYFFGFIGKFIRPGWFQLDNTNGIENDDLKNFMRLTVLISDVLIYFSAVYFFTFCFFKSNKKITTNGSQGWKKFNSLNQSITIVLILFQPCLILIDHGHFQYNSVMLGLVLFSIVSLLYDQLSIASFFFILAISFKQMALYYSPVIFFYILSLCFNPFQKRFDFPRLFAVAFSVILTLVVMFAPLVIFNNNFKDGLLNIKQALIRIFPFERGLFEDKVANFWCVTNILVKYRTLFDLSTLKTLSLGFTLLSILPSCLVIYFHPRKNLIPIAFASCSWGFYFFSFQVHEKSILLPLMPTTLLLSNVNDDEIFKMVCWVNNIGLFSLYPLLKKDELVLQYFVIGFLMNWLIGNLNINCVVNNFKNLFKVKENSIKNWSINFVIISSTVLALILHGMEVFLNPPSRYPDLWVVLNISFSFACFSTFWFWLNIRMFQIRNN
ncbi:dolichyl-P-Glc:Man(9)GlcNAc(2)-PP-dolichol alpha-1,3-glucosyltransferase [Ascoidea rubescens DSM 1968]|uniref:Alpha-1,3-glucosyltransferase n=1 Tax=Ascoidea rubescens DSM 1968 TaxID=1344418 RepID=A0A1D2VDY3_9ASCO|nr:glycosyltransferase family 57 protein [Ascoidea rubescens DSM 1968]ODV59809.1 glycosyltransferase family 57 protein [Ascoidea rubescens DSM 1968]